MLEKPLIPDFDETYEIINFEKELNDSNNKNLISAQKNFEKSIQTDTNQTPSDLALLEAIRRFAFYIETKDVRILALTKKEFYQCIQKVQKIRSEEVEFDELTPRPFLFLFLMVAEICLLIYIFRTIDILQSFTIFFGVCIAIALPIATFESFLKSILSSLERLLYNEEDLLIAEIAKLLEQKYQF
jgi:hypothetical protein